MDKLRMVSWWIRWEDLNWPNPDNLDRIRRRADRMAASSVNCAIVFGTHFRWDFLPYRVILHDYLATVADELHRRGIKFYDHHAVNLIHRYDTAEEMRECMIHSGPHLPFSPSRTAASDWRFNGKRLDDWRMRDVRTGEVLYFPQYAAEGFCYRNDEFIESYCEYVKLLLAETSIDGLMSDDAVHYMRFASCGCPVCRRDFKARTGEELPIGDHPEFWGNWDNPAFREWIDLRFESSGKLYAAVRSVLPENFPLTGCCSGSSDATCVGTGMDVREFLNGCNLIHLEMVGNMPPYKHDLPGWTKSISHHIANAGHHLAAAEKAGARCFGGGYGFTEPTGEIIWAVNKFIGVNCWFSTLKSRLGLPDSILATLPDDAVPVSKVFRFEADHPELFDGKLLTQAGLYFSYETRNHTLWGSLFEGFTHGFKQLLQQLFENGVSIGVALDIPANPEEFPVLVMPDAARMTEAEIAAIRRYLAAGGVVIAGGPCGFPEVDSPWRLPNRIPAELGFWEKGEREYAWMGREIEEPPGLEATFREVEPGFFYTPVRLFDERIRPELAARVRSHGRHLPVEIAVSTGYLCSIQESERNYFVHFLAADYDTEIDRELDAIRFHRSRVNLITAVAPIGVGSEFVLKSPLAAKVHVPFGGACATLTAGPDGRIRIEVDRPCSYLIVELAK